MNSMKRAAIVVAVLMTACSLSFTADDAATDMQSTQVFEKNIRLDFKLTPLEDNDKGVFVVVGSPSYSASISYSTDDMEISFSVKGEVHPLDDGRILVHYNMNTQFGGPEAEGEIGTRGSILLDQGVETEAAFLGEKTLVITASYPDPQKPAAKKKR